MTQGTLASGLVVEFRGTKNRELAAFRKTLEEKGHAVALTEMLNACTEQVVDPGPTNILDEDGKPDWSKALSGDRLQAAILLRIASFPEGHKYKLDLKCPRCPASRPSFPKVLDLRAIPNGDLLWYPMPEEAIESVRKEQPFVCTVDGKMVSFLLSDGRMEAQLEEVSRGDRVEDAAIAQARLRITEVEDVHANDVHRWLGDLTVAEYEVLEDAMDAVEGGVDIAIEAVCPEGHEFQAAVPFDVSFWRPQEGMRNRRKERLAAARSGV